MTGFPWTKKRLRRSTEPFPGCRLVQPIAAETWTEAVKFLEVPVSRHRTCRLTSSAGQRRTHTRPVKGGWNLAEAGFAQPANSKQNEGFQSPREVGSKKHSGPPRHNRKKCLLNAVWLGNNPSPLPRAKDMPVNRRSGPLPGCRLFMGDAKNGLGFDAETLPRSNPGMTEAAPIARVHIARTCSPARCSKPFVRCRASGYKSGPCIRIAVPVI